MGKNKKSWKDNAYFQDTSILNSETYNFYISAFEKVARSIFEWVNLPSSMNEEWLERSLYYYGMASLLKDEEFRIYKHKLYFKWWHKHIWLAD